MNPHSPSRPGVPLFLLIAFGWSWAVGALIWQTGAMQKPLLFQGLALLFMWGPALGAAVCAACFDRGRRAAALGVRPAFTARAWLWLALSFVIPAALIAAATLVDWAGPQVSPADPGAQLTAIARAQAPDAEIAQIPAAAGYAIVLGGVVLGALLNFPLMISEELGWRGWLWDRWRPLGFWRGNLLIGAVWGVWHAPLIVQGYNYPGMPVLGPLLMTGFCVLAAPLIGLVRERGGSVWHACLFHGTVNAGAGAGMVMMSTGVAFPWQGLLGIGGAAAMLAGWALAALAQRRSRPAES